MLTMIPIDQSQGMVMNHASIYHVSVVDQPRYVRFSVTVCVNKKIGRIKGDIIVIILDEKIVREIKRKMGYDLF